MATRFSFSHRIAGVTVRTESELRIPHLEEQRFERFRVRARRFDVRQRLHCLDPEEQSEPPLSADERERLVHCTAFRRRWLDYPVFRCPGVRAAARRCLDRPEMAHLELAWNRVTIRNFATNELDIFFPPDRREIVSTATFVAGFRNMVGTFLPNFDAILVHAAAVVRRERAALFLAPDSGGKTTLVKARPRRSVLSDDHIVLREESGRTVAHGTPLGPLTCGPRSAVLGGVFLVEKAERFGLVAAKPSEALWFIFGEQSSRWVVVPKSVRKRSYELLQAACHSVPTFRLSAPLDGVDWTAIDAAMSG